MTFYLQNSLFVKLIYFGNSPALGHTQVRAIQPPRLNSQKRLCHTQVCGRGAAFLCQAAPRWWLWAGIKTNHNWPRDRPAIVRTSDVTRLRIIQTLISDQILTTSNFSLFCRNFFPLFLINDCKINLHRKIKNVKAVRKFFFQSKKDYLSISIILIA